MNTAVLDACVLYSALLRDLFMRLTVELVFQPKWTERTHEEWMRNVLANRPDLKPEQLERTRALMDAWGRDWEVPEYETLLETLTLPDVDDRHVLAAAISAGATVIVTFNLSDFPAKALAPYSVRALHPAVFTCELLGEMPEAFVTAIRTHRARYSSTEDGGGVSCFAHKAGNAETCYSIRGGSRRNLTYLLTYARYS